MRVANPDERVGGHCPIQFVVMDALSGHNAARPWQATAAPDLDTLTDLQALKFGLRSCFAARRRREE